MKEQDLGHGNKIVGFDSFEEMQAYMADQEAEAQAEVAPEQLGIEWGGHALRMVDKDLVIWGEITTPEKYTEDTLRAGATDDEAFYELATLQEAYERGYRYGTWYSEVCPEGELGSAHCVSLWPITKEEFEEGRRNDWLPSPALVYKITKEVIASERRNKS